MTDFGILVPLSWNSLELVDMLNSRRRRPLTSLGMLKGVLIGIGNQLWEIAVGVVEDVGHLEIYTPIIYNPKIGFGRSNDQSLDMLLTVGIEENCDPADIIVAANKLSQVNPRHYTIESYDLIMKNNERAKFLPFDDYLRECMEVDKVKDMKHAPK